MKMLYHQKGETINIRKKTGYLGLFSCLGRILGQDQSQMQLIVMIGKAVCARPEKGTAVAAEYIQANYPNKAGFSSRNLRRMRSFSRCTAMIQN